MVGDAGGVAGADDGLGRLHPVMVDLGYPGLVEPGIDLAEVGKIGLQ